MKLAERITSLIEMQPMTDQEFAVAKKDYDGLNAKQKKKFHELQRKYNLAGDLEQRFRNFEVSIKQSKYNKDHYTFTFKDGKQFKSHFIDNNGKELK